MAGTYRATLLTRRGGLDALELVELPLLEPGPGQLRVKVRATGVGYTDVLMRKGNYAFAPRLPFVPGYEVAGVVDAIGPDVKGFFFKGQRVAALLVWGGYGEYVVRKAEHFIPIPDGVSDIQAAASVVNHVSAWQMVHRVAQVQRGETALVTGAAGGVGTALLQVLHLAGARTYGAAAARKHGTVARLGATPIDSGGGGLDVPLRRLERRGVDLAFDGLGGPTTRHCRRALRLGGFLVGYGFTGLEDAGPAASLRNLASVLLGPPLMGRRSTIYGLTSLYRRDPRPFRQDLDKVFELIAARTLSPVVGATVPLLEARRAQQLLEHRSVEGKVVLVA